MVISEYVNLYKTKQMYLINKTPLFTVSNTSFLHQNMKIFTVMQGHCHFQVNVLKFHLNLKELEMGGLRQYVQTLDLSGSNHLICWWRLENTKHSHVVMRTVGGHQHSLLIFLTSSTAVVPAKLIAVFSISPPQQLRNFGSVRKAACLRNYFFLSQDQP